MPRRKDREQINNTVSKAQYQRIKQAAALRKISMAEFNRYALRMAIEELGLEWPDDMAAWGKHERKG